MVNIEPENYLSTPTFSLVIRHVGGGEVVEKNAKQYVFMTLQTFATTPNVHS